jgi:Zn-dependent metalloprotease
VLAYEVRVRGVSARDGEADMRYFVDARTGKVLDKWNRIHTTAATGVGQTLFLGDINIITNSISGGFQLVDPTRGGGNTRDGLGKEISRVYSSAAIMTDADNNWGNNTESSVQSEASDAHFGVATTWDFYQNVFGRNGIYDDGVGVKSIVNVTFRSGGPATGGNAAWYGAPYKFMAYGLGTSTWYPVVAIDVAGHEMTHGVTEATANLDYANDAGGLNEASSDIMGTMVEFYANNAADAGDYMIGEKIYRSNPTGKSALRYMFRPGDADGGRSYNCYPAGGLGGVDPHYSSAGGRRGEPFGLQLHGLAAGLQRRHRRGRHRPRRGTAHLVPRVDRVLQQHRVVPEGPHRHAPGGGGPVRHGLGAIRRGGPRLVRCGRQLTTFAPTA